MPAQGTGLQKKNEKARVVAVNEVSGDILSVSPINEDTSNSDTVDGSTVSDFTAGDQLKDLESLQQLEQALDNFQKVSQAGDGANVNENVITSNNSLLTSQAGTVSQSPAEIVDHAGDSLTTATVSQSEVKAVTPVTLVSSTDLHVGVVGSNSVSSVNLGVVGSNSVSSITGKRPLTAGSNNSPVVTKFIITKNPNTSQPQPVPIQLSQVGGQTVNIAPFGSGANVIPQLSQVTAVQTPTKTITISSQGIVSPVKPIQMATVAGTPPKLPISKIPISPAKTPTKITMIPVKSPQKIAPATANFTIIGSSAANLSGTSNRPTMITMSPSKVIKQPMTVQLVQQKQPNIQPAAAQTIVIPAGKGQLGNTMVNPTIKTITQPTVKQVTMTSIPSNVQQIQVPGSKFHYVRLVAPQSQATVSLAAKPSHVVQTKPIAPATGTTMLGQGGQMKITLPVQQGQLVNQRQGIQVGGTTIQRILLPAGSGQQVAIRPAPASSITPTAQAQIRTSLPTGTAQLPSGATIISTSSANASGGPNIQGFALVPASYVQQLQNQIQQTKQPSAPATVVAPSQSVSVPASLQKASGSDYIPIASIDPVISASAVSKGVNGSPLEPAGARPRKPCNCTKSQCLKLYCDCFANGEFCHNCNCMNCANNLEHEEERSRAIKSCLDRNPAAFHPKIGKGRQDGDRRHNKGCNCKRSGCLKNYCECYEAKIMCSNYCKCIGCKNFEESPERKTLMHLADAAEVRVQQQTAAKTKLSSQISDVPSRPPAPSSTGERLPFSFITEEVAEATCACLLAQAEEAERLKMPPVVQERMVIEEFGRCLLQIIESANKTKAPDPGT